MAWTCLVIAGLLEICWAVGLKYTHGFSRLWPSVGTVASMVGSFLLLAQALKTIPVGTGYAVWTGIGAAGTAIVGMAVLGESREIQRIPCILPIKTGLTRLEDGRIYCARDAQDSVLDDSEARRVCEAGYEN